MRLAFTLVFVYVVIAAYVWNGARRRMDPRVALGGALGWPIGFVQYALAGLAAATLHLGSIAGVFSPRAREVWENWFISQLVVMQHCEVSTTLPCARALFEQWKAMGIGCYVREVPGAISVPGQPPPLIGRVIWHQQGVDLRPYAQGFISGWGTRHMQSLKEVVEGAKATLRKIQDDHEHANAERAERERLAERPKS